MSSSSSSSSSSTAIPNAVAAQGLTTTAAAVSTTLEGPAGAEVSVAPTVADSADEIYLDDCTRSLGAFADKVGLWLKAIAGHDSKSHGAAYSSVFGGGWRQRDVDAVRSGKISERLCAAMESPAFYAEYSSMVLHAAGTQSDSLTLAVEPSVWDDKTQVQQINWFHTPSGAFCLRHVAAAVSDPALRRRVSALMKRATQYFAREQVAATTCRTCLDGSERALNPAQAIAQMRAVTAYGQRLASGSGYDTDYFQYHAYGPLYLVAFAWPLLLALDGKSLDSAAVGAQCFQVASSVSSLCAGDNRTQQRSSARGADAQHTHDINHPDGWAAYVDSWAQAPMMADSMALYQDAERNHDSRVMRHYWKAATADTAKERAITIQARYYHSSETSVPIWSSSLSPPDAAAAAERIMGFAMAERDTAIFDGSVFVVDYTARMEGDNDDDKVVNYVMTPTRDLYLPNVADVLAYVDQEAVHDPTIVTRHMQAARILAAVIERKNAGVQEQMGQTVWFGQNHKRRAALVEPILLALAEHAARSSSEHVSSPSRETLGGVELPGRDPVAFGEDHAEHKEAGGAEAAAASEDNTDVAADQQAAEPPVGGCLLS
ncbi:uncharacterized protein ACA1_324920 [Acanthamoeba castellanii str. Neff]|uniref:Uncharacterized protein n=1 Tax=Acanthamoeba castellanii (strain ATCC 30010 / Neff) TaxID=1257118 RepID=L8GH75_ACACF|nr:uncharacterized protein ACA1_324920 [Acanthamoeba castellanii str. Neff]ELR12445.1 hypothetical protein ACA1_324920 [Acanthamoeba castellanii str. Neff]